MSHSTFHTFSILVTRYRNGIVIITIFFFWLFIRRLTLLHFVLPFSWKWITKSTLFVYFSGTMRTQIENSISVFLVTILSHIHIYVCGKIVYTYFFHYFLFFQIISTLWKSMQCSNLFLVIVVVMYDNAMNLFFPRSGRKIYCFSIFSAEVNGAF